MRGPKWATAKLGREAQSRVLSFVHHPDYLSAPDELKRLTRPGAAFPRTFAEVVQGAVHLRGQAVVAIGLLIVYKHFLKIRGPAFPVIALLLEEGGLRSMPLPTMDVLRNHFLRTRIGDHRDDDCRPDAGEGWVS